MKKSLIVLALVMAALSVALAGRSAEQPKLPAFLTEPGEKTGRKCVMFIFAHYDDDSTICGTVNMFLRSGWETHEVWLTAAGIPGSKLWGSPELRRAEMNRVADAMGLPFANRHVLDIPDRECVKNLPRIMDLVTGLVKQYRPSVIVTDAYEGGHWDHDACCLAGDVAGRRVDFPIARFEVPTYNASGPKIMPWRMNGFIKAWGPWEYVMLDREAWAMRRKVRYGYESQWFLMWPEGLLGGYRHLTGKGEPIRETPNYDFLKPPHPGTLMLQSKVGVMPGADFSTWRSAVLQIPEFQGAPIKKTGS
jgi:hypothetical protein